MEYKDPVICGIDPGLTGALSFICDDVVEVEDMPTVANPTGKGRVVQEHSVAHILKEYNPHLVIIEKQQAMPGQGVSSMFKIGEGYGILKGVCAALDLRTRIITAPTWKRASGLIGKEKDASRGLAMQLWPSQTDFFVRRKDHGRADAALIAKYGKDALV